ncbi:hypothetical protein K439DRAFT_1621217 [Ramaria rubella]|nr:hypothetical protein K439DRAFT_1621217 [Ramaria rubella]
MRFLAIVSVCFAVTHVTFASRDPPDTRAQNALVLGHSLFFNNPHTPTVDLGSITDDGFTTSDGNHHQHVPDPGTPAGQTPATLHTVSYPAPPGQSRSKVVLAHTHYDDDGRGQMAHISHVVSIDASGKAVAAHGGEGNFYLPHAS